MQSPRAVVDGDDVDDEVLDGDGSDGYDDTTHRDGDDTTTHRDGDDTTHRDGDDTTHRDGDDTTVVSFFFFFFCRSNLATKLKRNCAFKRTGGVR